MVWGWLGCGGEEWDSLGLLDGVRLVMRGIVNGFVFYDRFCCVGL